MILEAIVVAVIAAFYIGFEDGKFSVIKTAKWYGIGFVITAMLTGLLLWLLKPAFVGIMDGWYRVIALPVLIFSVVVIVLQFVTEEVEEKECWIQGLKILVVLLVAVWLLLTPVFYHQDLYNIPEVEISDNISAGGVFAPIDTEHIRLVDQDMAYYFGNKVLGESKENLGSQFEVRKGDFHIQMVNDHLWWVAPLQFRGFWKWWNLQSSPGFVMVDAEDPQATPRLCLGYQMKYLSSAYWSKELHRHAYLKGYEHVKLEDFTFEITDNLAPRYVLSLTEPTVLNDGFITRGVIAVNPETGKIEEYPIGSTPGWIDRVVPERIAKDYLFWYGKYEHGWLNTILAQEDVNVPTSIQGGTELWLIYGSDGEPYWYTGMTSPSGTDQSLTNMMLVSLKTGKVYQYKISGANEQAVVDAVDSDVSLYSNWYSSVPIPYNVYGQLTYVVPVTAHTERGNIYKGVAFVDAKNVHIEREDNKARALEKYRAYLFSKGKGIAITSSSDRKKINGTVERIASVVLDGSSSFRIWLNDSEIIFAVDPVLIPKVAITSVGDSVIISYDDTGETVIATSSFDNLEIDARISEKQLAYEAHEANRTQRVEENWDVQKEHVQAIEDLRRE